MAARFDGLAGSLDQTRADIRAAITNALDERAAVLRFSDPRPLRTEDIKRLRQELYAFAQSPRKMVAGVLILGACIILIQVSYATGTTARYAVTEIGAAFVDKIAAGIRSEGITRNRPSASGGK